MFKTIAEAYLILLYILLHVSLFSCDSTCMFPVSSFTAVVPRSLHLTAASMIRYANIETKYLMQMGQFILMGDLLFLALWASKLFSYVLKRFFVTLICIIVSIAILTKIGAI
jgi:hypothetical protein